MEGIGGGVGGCIGGCLDLISRRIWMQDESVVYFEY